MSLQTPDLPLLDLDEARARLVGLCAPVAAREALVARVEDGFLAQDAFAPEDRPAQACAARDGLACASADLVGVSAFSPASLMRAPLRVEIGDPLPEGCDCVVDRACVEALGPVYAVSHAAAPGEGVTRAGEDLRAGALLARSGARVQAPLASLLHAAGLRATRLRRPALRLVAAASHAGAQTSAFICALLQAAGARVDLCVAAGRSLEDLRACLDVAGVDALVSVGGTGAGESDATIAALRARGTQLAHGLALAPGSSAAFGLLMGAPVLALPGRADGALAAWLALGLPMLRSLAGASAPPPLEAAPLTRKITSAPGMSELVLFERVGAGWRPFGAGAQSLDVMARAEGFLVSPAGSEGLAAGAFVAPLSLRAFCA
jgi:molybdopterin biosynthesis enzyme